MKTLVAWLYGRLIAFLRWNDRREERAIARRALQAKVYPFRNRRQG